MNSSVAESVGCQYFGGMPLQSKAGGHLSIPPPTANTQQKNRGKIMLQEKWYWVKLILGHSFDELISIFLSTVGWL